MLRHCHAHVIGASADQNEALINLALAAGFASAHPILGPDGSDIARTINLPAFFLMHRMANEERGQAIVTAIRTSTNSNIRYAPVIAFLPLGKATDIARLAQLGFDDVLTLTGDADTIRDRLSRQVNAECIYIETATYFGPDRRRHSRVIPEQPRYGNSSHTRIVIIRPPRGEIQVLRRDLIIHKSMPPPDHGRQLSRLGG